MWPVTRIQELIGIAHPIAQAPMAGGPTTPELVAAVSEAGGLGGFGSAYRTPDQIREEIRAVRRLTGRPFAVNLFVEGPVRRDDALIAAMIERLRPYHEELGLQAPQAPATPEPVFRAQVEVVLEERVPVFSWTFGIPPADILAACRERGIVTIGTATSVREALALAEAGVDAVTAQGYEAGGHQGSFMKPGDAAPVGTLALVPQVADAVDLPVLAAGGIADARGIAAALCLGAAGVQIGTAYLGCPETGTSPAHREALRTATDESTELTRAFSGRTARGIRNRMLDALRGVETPAFPLQNSLTQPLRKAAAAAGRAEFLSLWAGQAAALAQTEPAGELTRRLAAETLALLGRLGRGPDAPPHPPPL